VNFLSVELRTPIGVNGPSNVERTIAALAAAPMWHAWIDDLPAALAAAARRTTIVYWEGRTTPPHPRQCPFRGLHSLNEAMTLAATDGIAQAALSVVARDEEQRWSYLLSLGYVTDRETGEFLPAWGGLELMLSCPSLQSALPDAWVPLLVDFMVEFAPLIGPGLGVARVHDEDTPHDPAGYSMDRYGPPQDPAFVPGAQWLSVLPPRVVDRLGGWTTFAAAAPLHQLHPVDYADGRRGAIALVTATLPAYPGRPEQRWRQYLTPVLAEPPA
jgi:hypothetical protein